MKGSEWGDGVLQIASSITMMLRFLFPLSLVSFSFPSLFPQDILYTLPYKTKNIYIFFF